jgi:hypothetical protein
MHIKSINNEPYDPHLPDMPPLINDVVLPSEVNPEAEEIRRFLEKQAAESAE